MAKKWIQKAIKKPGAFTDWCKQKGFGGVTEECIRAGLKSKDPTTRRRAALARTLRKLGKRRKGQLGLTAGQLPVDTAATAQELQQLYALTGGLANYAMTQELTKAFANIMGLPKQDLNPYANLYNMQTGGTVKKKVLPLSWSK